MAQRESNQMLTITNEKNMQVKWPFAEFSRVFFIPFPTLESIFEQNRH